MSEQQPTTGLERIRSVAVTAEDVVDAFVYTQENPGEAVLRVTPPFHGRMRARLHVFQQDDALATGAHHIDPKLLLEREVVASYPTLADVAERVERDGGDTDAVSAHHATALEHWRDQALERLVDRIPLDAESDGGRHVVTVSVLRRSR